MSGVAISPQTKWGLPVWLGFGAHQTKLLLEASLPNVDVDLSIVKDDSISCGPNNLAGSNDYFPKISITKVFSSLYNHIQTTDIKVPIDWDSGPTIYAEWAFKK